MSTAPVLQIRTPANPRAHRSTRSHLSPAELLAVLKLPRTLNTRLVHDPLRVQAWTSRV